MTAERVPLTAGWSGTGFRPLLPVRWIVVVVVTAVCTSIVAASVAPTAAAVVLAVAAAVLVLAYPAITVLAFSLSFGLVWSVPDWPTSPTKAAAILLVAGTALAMVARRRLPKLHWAHLLFLAFGAWTLVSSEATADGVYSRDFAVSIIGWGFAAIAIYQYNDGARGLRLVAGSYVLGVSAGAALAVVDYLRGSSAVVAPVAGDVNDFGVLTATALFLAIGLVREASVPIPFRVAAGICAVLCLVAVVASFSRGTWTGVGVALVVHAIIRRNDRRPILVALGVVLVLFVVTLPFTADRLAANASEKGFVASSNVDTRLDAWQLGLRLFAERPVTGWGIGSIQPFYASTFSIPPGGLSLAFAHNSYVEVLYGTGIVGAALFLAIMVIAIARTANGPSRFAPGSQLAPMLLPAVIATLVASFTVSELTYAPLWMVLVLGMAAHPPHTPAPARTHARTS